jgi:hypothetical protein
MYKIYDNAIEQDVFDEVQSAVVNNDEMPWFYTADPIAGYHNSSKAPARLDQSQFFHLAYSENSGGSGLYPIAIKAIKACNIRVGTLLRARFSMHTWGSESIVHSPAHVDCQRPAHKVGILYLNDSDGDTEIYEEKSEISSSNSSKVYLGEHPLNILAKVTPKANRLVLFDGEHFHTSASPCTHTNRFVLNFVYLEK